MLNISAICKALNLPERAALLVADRSSTSRGGDLDAYASSRRLRKWRSQRPFDQNEWFGAMLDELGVTEEEFVSILEEPGLDRLDPPGWAEVDSHSQGSSNEEDVARIDAFLRQSGFNGFLLLVTPLLRGAVTRVADELRKIEEGAPRVPFDASNLAKLLLSGLPHRLGEVVGKVAVLEMHVAKLREELTGDSPQERFNSFIERLVDKDVVDGIFEEYPVMVRCVATTIDLAVTSGLQFVKRLCEDWESIVSTLCDGSDPGSLEAIESGLGDKHCGGNSVLMARFSSGFKLVYKPRSLEADLCFGRLLDWLHRRGSILFRMPKILSRDTYGWSEFINPCHCESREEISRFYERQGALLALLYALAANDFHSENIIAAGEYPVPIDLESLFQADFGQFDLSIYRSAASFVMNSSVLGVGILPAPQQGRDAKLIDRSGMGGQAGQLALRKTPMWQGTGTDAISLIRKELEMAPSANRPSLNGEDVPLLEYIDDILAGFENLYGLLLRFREDLMEDGGILAEFSCVAVRSIFRLTQFYSLLLTESFHPDLLRDASERDRLFARLWFGIDQSPLAEKVARIIPSEFRDLWLGDVPFFWTRVNSRDVWTSEDKCLRLFFRRSGWEVACSRLQLLGPEDLERQLWLIRGALSAIAIADSPHWTTYRVLVEDRFVPREKILGYACAIGDRLLKLAFSTNDSVSWIGLSLIGGRQWALLPFGLDLYGGIPGIALFLAHLGWITGDRRYTEVAEVAVVSIRNELKASIVPIESIGGFEGWGGLIHVWVHLAALWKRDDLLREAEEMAYAIDPLIEVDKGLDVVSGAAGGIAALLELHGISGDAAILALACKMGDHLISSASPLGEGLGWVVPTNPGLPLTGFSHGASGIAYALLRLYQSTKDEHYKESALKALTFERAVFMQDLGTWPDFRDVVSFDSGSKKFMTAWCHGAPGIGLSRLRMVPLLGYPFVGDDIQAALAETLRHGFGSNHSLCHGDLGSLDFILTGSQCLGGEIWQESLKRMTAQIVKSIDEFGFLCGVPLGIETPGLLCGLAGIGYGLLRLASPSQVPSVLLLDPPLPQ